MNTMVLLAIMVSAGVNVAEYAAIPDLRRDRPTWWFVASAILCAAAAATLVVSMFQ
jgi:hypothetical protein